MSNKLLGNLPKGLLFVLSAPSGTGKTTLATKLFEEFPNVAPSISCTTRAPRPGEVNGRDYLFLSKEEFQQQVHNNAFLEHATIFDKSYGTLKKTVEDLQNSRKHVLMVIDTQGMQQLRRSGIACTTIFLYPPSWKTLEERLKTRGTESAEERKRRLRIAEAEIASAHLYDYKIVNDDLLTAYQILRSIFIATESKECTWNNLPKNT